MDGESVCSPCSSIFLLIAIEKLGTEGLVRGSIATDTGSPIMIPVGPGTLGRIMNVTGDPIDERGPIKATKKLPIHADPPEFIEQSTTAEVLVTGIKVVDLLAPYARGGKIGLFGGAGVGKTVFIQELIVLIHHLHNQIIANRVVEQHRQSSWWFLGVHWCR
jgi:F0F1-type ATP synthase beta subunit